MIGIPEPVHNAYIVRLDNREVEISGVEMTPSEAAENAATEYWPWLRGRLEKTRLVERAGDWSIYQVWFEQGATLDYRRVAVCKRRENR